MSLSRSLPSPTGLARSLILSQLYVISHGAFSGRETILKRTRELLTFHKLSEINPLPAFPGGVRTTISFRKYCAATGFPIVSIATYDDARRLMVFRGLLGIPGQIESHCAGSPTKKYLFGDHHANGEADRRIAHSLIIRDTGAWSCGVSGRRRLLDTR